MANLGTGDSNVNIDGGISGFIDFGGNDTYTILGSLSGDVEIVDNQASTINLPEGLEISDAAFLPDGVQFTINGNVLTLLGEPSLFSFVFGGTPLDPAAGTSQTFFETALAFGITVPAPGAGINNATITGDVNADGSVGDGTALPVDPEESYSLTADAASVDEGEVATFSLATTNVDAGTAVDYTITGVEAADISGGLTGSVTIGTDGTADIAVQVLADQLTEGVETLTVSVNNGAATASTQVQDTSVADAGSYVSGQGGNGVVSEFNIELVFDSVVSTDQRDAFELAADYLSSLITSDLPDVGAIDDVRITAVLVPDDGEFGVVGFAGPDALRPESLLPYEGSMTFDTADVDRLLTEGAFADTVAHEMLHALGFGTLWEDTFLDLLSGGPDLRFTGDNAIAAYDAEFPDIAGADANSATGVPVETDGGEGTAGGHWDEDIFTNEVMTGYGMAGTDDYTSGMTVAALEDMGYDTVFDVGLPGATMPQLDDFVMA